MKKYNYKIDRKKEKEKGITLVALVITVVVMLILAGVAIAAVVNGDGLFDRTRYAAELQNFSQMQEAIQLYNFNNAIDNTNTLPVTRNVSVEELESDQNLKTEIGYYRVFMMTGERPILPQDFSGDFMDTPSGVADLYYLDNEKLNVNTNKKYIYDTVTGEIYLIDGIKVKEKMVYSESGIKEMLNGNYIPNYVENVTMPPGPEPNTGAGYDYRFANLVATSSNLYKIYNNGDIYAIGSKGYGLNTSKEEMDKLRNDLWVSIDFNNIVNDFSKIFLGSQTYRSSQAILTKSGEVYVSGSNGMNITNKFGLSQEALESYNENGLNKLDFKYGKVKNMFIGDDMTFIITEDNKLYATGLNTNGQLGIGTYKNTEEYMEVKGIEDVENIKYIHTSGNDWVIIEKNDNTFYFSGSNARNAIGDGRSNLYKTNVFEQIWNEGEFDIDQDIKKMSTLGSMGGLMALKNDGTLLIAASSDMMELTDLIGTDKTKFRKLRSEVGSNITDIQSFYRGGLIIEQTINNEKKYYGYSDVNSNLIGIGSKDYTIDERKLYEIELPQELIDEGVKEFKTVQGRYGVMFISNTGNVYYCGDFRFSGIEGQTENIENVIKLPISNIEKFYEVNMNYGLARLYLLGKDGKVYTINNPLNLLDKKTNDYTFKKIASNMKSVMRSGTGIVYVSNDNNLYVAGSNKKKMGVSLTDTSKQYQYVKIEDSNIGDKVKNAYIYSNVYVLTLNGDLYMVQDGKFVKILSNIEGMYTAYQMIIAYNQNAVWIGKENDLENNNLEKIDLSTISPSLVNNILDVSTSAESYYILTKDGKIWSKSNYNYVTGTGVAHNNFQQIPQNMFGNKKVVKLVNIGSAWRVQIALTEDGKLYGWGADRSLLGLGETTTEIQSTPILLPIDNVKDIIAMEKAFIVVKENGEVWGTGNNENGILGRWISSDVKYAKTINQTAYEWVRCPALEK